MVFPYLAVTSKLKRPIIPIILRVGNQLINYQALIDTGSDYCIFSIELAKILGVGLSTEKVYTKGVGKNKISGHWGEEEINFEDKNADGFIDLHSAYDKNAAGLTVDTLHACLTGKLINGIPLGGCSKILK